ncbi:nitroreductase family protein [Candidatus Contubernalis alkaliaceticus]|uniref:nitroreductase family protein n=1 Tax=Candidatus Contubernalis alkaliaceticus TaxID=338645 RepID=UPI001F4BF5B3|nr:nitroreductase family protein [Candidatus Contubernalis alkalaceticus]
MLEKIKSRRSIRNFQSSPVEEEKILQLIDCARLAPSARNVQPWKFIVVTDKETRDILSQMLDTARFVSGAPLCIAVFCQGTKYYLEDGCAATMNILLASEAMGLGACWIAGDKKAYGPAVQKLLGVPEGFKLVSLIAVGYPVELPGTKSKKTLEEVICRERFQ